MRRIKRVAATTIAGLFAIAVLASTVQASAEAVGREEGVSGAIVMVNDYCAKVANGELFATDPLLLMQGDRLHQEMVGENLGNDEVVSGPATEIESAIQDGEHIRLNLNYSRLGIANKVSNYLNVRKKPSKDSRIIGKMVKNSGCHIYKVTKDGWAKIISGGVVGFVKTEYLTMDEEAEAIVPEVGRDCVEIMTDSLNVRALPSVTAPIYSVCDAGEEFEIKKEDVDQEFLEKIIEKEEISDEAIERAGGMQNLLDHMNEFICIMVDDDYAFVSKEYVREQFSLKRATRVKYDP